jgi:hypothetical protein
MVCVIDLKKGTEQSKFYCFILLWLVNSFCLCNSFHINELCYNLTKVTPILRKKQDSTNAIGDKIPS